MATTVQPTTATAQSTQHTATALTSGVQVPTVHLADQSITAFAHAEIIPDEDTGQPVFCLATDQQFSDFQAVTPARGLAAAEKLREQADRIEAIAQKYAADVTIPAYLAEYGIELEELDTASLFEDKPELAAAFHAMSLLTKDGRLVVAVPKEQTPVARLTAIRSIVFDLKERGQL